MQTDPIHNPIPTLAVATPVNEQRTRWGRFLDSVLPAPSPDRLVRVATVGRTALPLAEDSLADVDLHPVVTEVASPNGDSQFTILVSAKDSQTASAVLASF